MTTLTTTEEPTMVIEVKQTLYNTQKELFVILSTLVTYLDNIANPSLSQILRQKEFTFLFSAIVTYYNNCVRLLLILKQQKGGTPRITRGSASLEPKRNPCQACQGSTGSVLLQSITTQSSVSTVIEPVIDTVEEDKSVKEEEFKVGQESKGEQSVKEEDEDYIQVEEDKSYQSYAINGDSIISPSPWSSSSRHQRSKEGSGS